MSKRDEDDDLGIIPNRIKTLRKERHMTVEQLAERAGLSTGHVNNIENHKKGFTMASLHKIAKALNVKPAELLDVANAWQEVPIMGYIGDKGIFRPSGENGNHEPKRVRVPLALGDTIALRIEGPGLIPRYDDGVTLICSKSTVEPKAALGKECYIVLTNGVSMIRRIDAGSTDGRYILTFHNQPPQLNVEILNCRPILMSRPPE